MCGRGFCGQNQLIVHIETVHEGIKKHQCPICSGKFARKHDVTQHLRTVHGNSEDKPYPCTQCDAAFSGKGHLTKHILTAHEQAKPFSCEFCDSTFAKRKWLTDHIVNAHS